MKKTLIVILAIAFVALGFGTMPTNAAEAIAAGSLVKTADNSTIYYLGDDNKLYVFPNDKTYFSWFENFDEIKVISNETFASYALGGNVYYKPGSLLVKTPTSLKVYAVGINGELRWIQTEELARAYYGENWNLLVDDVPEGFFTNYFFGTAIANEGDYNPDEEEAQAPTVSHGKGLKAKKAIKNKALAVAEKRCKYLENSVNRLQKRAERWGLTVPTIGDDYISKCVASSTQNNNDDDDDKKITVCKVPKGNPNAAHTITISKNALKKHFRDGYTIGACNGQNDDDDDDDNADVTAPVISNINANPATSSAIVTWNTNEISDSKVLFDNEYPFTNAGSVSNNNDVATHTLMIEGLTPNTVYHYVVISKDLSDNEASSTHLTFTTDAIDTTSPVITNVVNDPATTSVVISWTTNEVANSKIYYSTQSNASTTSAISDAAFVTAHNLTISGLATSTKYYFTVESADEQANKTVSSEYDFTTDAQ